VNEIIARRAFTPLYIWLDIAFLVIFMLLLVRRRRYMALFVGWIMGLVYMIVDYGIFHLWLESRSISEGHSLFWVLLWMSISYGFTNFAWIWLWMDQDEHLREWTLLIVGWWFCCPHIAQTFSQGVEPIIIQRTTSSYHGGMALILFVSYLGVIIYNVLQDNPWRRIKIGRLLIIGICVQFGWELALLLGGIRSYGFPLEQKLRTLVVNSLLETNLGMPAAFAIYIALSRKVDHRLHRQEPVLSFGDRLEAYNRQTTRASAR
jgi:hypothetical protein